MCKCWSWWWGGVGGLGHGGMWLGLGQRVHLEVLPVDGGWEPGPIRASLGAVPCSQRCTCCSPRAASPPVCIPQRQTAAAAEAQQQAALRVLRIAVQLQLGHILVQDSPAL